MRKIQAGYFIVGITLAAGLVFWIYAIAKAKAETWQVVHAAKAGDLPGVQAWLTARNGTEITPEQQDALVDAVYYAGSRGDAETMTNANGLITAIRLAIVESPRRGNDEVCRRTFPLIAEDNDLKVVKRLLEKGIDVNCCAVGGGFTALLRSAYAGHPEMVKLLLARGADPNLEVVHEGGDLSGRYTVLAYVRNILAHNLVEADERPRYARVIALLRQHGAKDLAAPLHGTLPR